MTRKHKLQILKELLEAVSEGYNGTSSIMKRLKTSSYTQFKIYKNLSLEKGFIKEDNGKYIITEIGEDYIGRYNSLVELLK